MQAKIGKITASQILVDKLNQSCPNQTVQDFINLSQSAGLITGGEIIDNGDLTITVNEGCGWVRIADDNVSSLKFFSWETSLPISVSPLTTRYIGIIYNAGNPIIDVRTTDTWDLDTEFPLGSYTRDDGVVHIMTNPYWVGDSTTNIIQRFQADGLIQRDSSVGGIILSEKPTRRIVLTGGKLWSRLNDKDFSTIDTSISGTFDSYYSDGSNGFTPQYNLTQWDNLHYDDGTGTLATVTSSKYAVLWFYVDMEGHISCIYGTAVHSTSAKAEEEPQPTNLPDRVKLFSILVGRLIFKGNDGAIVVSSAFNTTFTPSQASNHANLTNLDYESSGHTGFASKSFAVAMAVGLG